MSQDRGLGGTARTSKNSCSMIKQNLHSYLIYRNLWFTFFFESETPVNWNGRRLSVFMFMIMLATQICSLSWTLFLLAVFCLSLFLNPCSGLVDLCVWIVTPTDEEGSGDTVWLPAFPTPEPCQHLALIWSVINVSPHRCAHSSPALIFLLQLPALPLGIAMDCLEKLDFTLHRYQRDQLEGY